jgi:hypothetical protein
LERRVIFNEIGEKFPSSVVSEILHQKKSGVHTSIKSISHQYHYLYLKIVELDQRLSRASGAEETQGIYNVLDRLYKMPNCKMPNSGESETLKLVKERSMVKTVTWFLGRFLTSSRAPHAPNLQKHGSEILYNLRSS